MTTWETITPVGSAVAVGVEASPGPTVTYSSTAGSTLIAAGSVVPASWGSFTGFGLNSVTDTAGNVWQFSLAPSQDPPAGYAVGGLKYATFVAWCVNAAAVTSVSFANVTGGSDTWNLVLAEFGNVAGPGWGATAAAANSPGVATPKTSVHVSTPDDLVVGVVFSHNGAMTAEPSNATAFTGVTGIAYATGPAVTPGVASFVTPGQAGSSFGGSSINCGTLPDITPGDVIVLDVVAVSGVTVSGWPAGFAQVLTVSGANDPTNNRYVATKLADGSEGGTVQTVTLSGSANAAGMMYPVRGIASATPLNTATATASGYQTSLATAALTVNDPSDVTVYGYGGVTSPKTGSPVAASPGALSDNHSDDPAGTGIAFALGWGLGLTPAAGSSTIALDTLDYGLDFPVLQLGAGGSVTFAWTMNTACDNSVALMSFGAAAVPVPDEPMTQTF
jgi:hypothetical protein